MKRNIVLVVVTLVTAAVVGLGVALVTVGNASAAQGTVRVWESPAASQARVGACIERERSARGIPAGGPTGNAYVAWVDANRGTAAWADWSAAFAACRDLGWPSGKWNFTGMVRVR